VTILSEKLFNDKRTAMSKIYLPVFDLHNTVTFGSWITGLGIRLVLIN